MKTLLLTMVALLLAAPCAAQIAVVDTDPLPFNGTGAKVTISQGITIGPTADVLVVDVGSLGNTSFAGFNFQIGSTPMVLAASQTSSATYKTDTAIYYLDLTPSTTGSLTLAGTFGTATAGVLDYYTLSCVNTAIAPIVASANGGTAATCSLTVSNSAGAWAAVDQATKVDALQTQSYGCTSGLPSALTFAVVSATGGNSLAAGDGYVSLMSSGANTITATVPVNASNTSHTACAAVFSAFPISGPPIWTAGTGNWSAAVNWNTLSVPNGTGATAVFSQTAATTYRITLDDSPTLGTLFLGNSGASSTAYVLTGGTLNLANSGSGATISVSGFQEIDSQIAGSENLRMQGSGQLNLTGTNAYSGGTVLSSGLLVAGDGPNTSASVSALGSGVVTLNGGTLAAGTAGGSVAGLVLGGSAAHTIAPGAGVTSGYGVLNLNGGLSGNSYTTLAFNLNQSTYTRFGANGEPIYIGDIINLGGSGLSGSGNFSFGGITPAIGDYRLVGGSLGSPILSNFTLPSFSTTNTVALSTTADTGYLDLVVMPLITPTTYNMTALFSSSLMHAGDITSGTATASITNAGTGRADNLAYAGLTVVGSGAFAYLGGPTSGTLAQGGVASVTLSYTATVPGVINLSPSVSTALNATLGTPANLGTVTGVTIDVFSGSGSWTGDGGSWANSAKWTSVGGIHAVPGTFGPHFADTDTAAFGSSGGTITLDTASPSLAAINFSNYAASYTIAQGSGSNALTLAGSSGLASVTISGTQTITAPLVLATSAVFEPDDSGLLILAGSISDGGSNSALVLEATGAAGLGTLILSGTNSYGGGTDVEAGTLVVNNSSALPAGSSLIVGAGGTFIFDTSIVADPEYAVPAAAAAHVEAVPEPSTWGLAVVGAAVLCVWRRKSAMKIVLLLIALLLLPGRLFAGEPEQGIGLGSPEPNTIGLLGAFFLFGIPTWLYRRRRAADAQRVREAEEEEPYAVVRKAA